MAEGRAGKTSKDRPIQHGDKPMSGLTGPTRLPSAAVLLSTYNVVAYLEAQIESLHAREGVSVRLHARNDGSTDETLSILRRHAGIWPELSDLEPSSNLGAAASFLELLQTAPDTDYYAFCDQDDVWLPDKLARAAAALAKRRDLEHDLGRRGSERAGRCPNASRPAFPASVVRKYRYWLHHPA